MPRKKATGVDKPATLWDSVRERVLMSLGDEVVASGWERVAVGLPLPLVLRFLFQRAVLPLGKLITLTGKQQSGKSALLFEIIRWHCLFGGAGYVLDTEGKDEEQLFDSIAGRLANKERFPCESQHEWMSLYQELLNVTKDEMEGSGRLNPACYGVDSVAANLAEETRKKIFEDGSPGRSIPVETRHLAQYLRAMASQTRGWPFTLIFTNHLKQAISMGYAPPGPPQEYMPGGQALYHHTAIIVKLALVKTAFSGGWEFNQVKFRTEKNSLGPKGRQIEACMRWQFRVTPEGRPYQVTYWDWDTATIELLERLSTAKSGTFDHAAYQNLENLLDMNFVSGSGKKGKRFWSEALGISRADALPYADAARVLEGAVAIMPRIHGAMGILDGVTFKPGVEYLEQIRDAAEELRRNPVPTTSVGRTLADLGDNPVLSVDDLPEESPEGTDGALATEEFQ